MAGWTDQTLWDELISGLACPVCVSGGPTHRIADGEGCWLTMGTDAPPLPGTCALFFPRHVVELHELSGDEAAQFMRAAQRVSAAVARFSGAVKINCELHGNTIPHLHMHFYPRYPRDPFKNRPIDPQLHGGSEERRRLLAVRSKLVEASEASSTYVRFRAVADIASNVPITEFRAAP